MKRKYDYTGIMDTPFTIVVSLPEHDHSGNYRVHAIEEIHRSHAKGTHFNSNKLSCSDESFQYNIGLFAITWILFNGIYFAFLKRQELSEIILRRMLSIVI